MVTLAVVGIQPSPLNSTPGPARARFIRPAGIHAKTGRSLAAPARRRAVPADVLYGISLLAKSPARKMEMSSSET